MSQPSPTANGGGASASATGYQRREPENTLLYRVVARELDALREDLVAASPYGSGLPAHVDKELDAYLRCGILAHGFGRVVCHRCRAEHLVALSCKGRGICPSCTTRRMYDTAAALVDRVLPRCPFRQWVATFPRRVRYHLAADPKLAADALRLVLRILFAFQRRRARHLGEMPGRANSNGAVSFVQRFNSAVELALHFHILIPDGVFVRDDPDPDAEPRFVEIAPPTDRDVAQLLDVISRRVTDLLRRRGRLDDSVTDEDPEPQLHLATRPAKTSGQPFVEEKLPPLCARKDGFSLHAGTAIHANDRLGLERICRYGLRPPLSQGRLTEAPDGTLLYTMKRRFSDGRHVLRFAPRELLLRLCALVPPRGFHMTRYAGLFSGHARGRYALTGRGMHDEMPTEVLSATAPPASARPPPDAAPPADTSSAPASLPSRSGSAGLPPSSSEPAVLPLSSPIRPLSSLLPGLSSPVRPLSSLLMGATLHGPDDPTRGRRLDWAKLLKRAWAVDVLTCPRCAGPMRIVAFIEDERVARKILEHLGLPSRAPPRGRPARPGQQLLPFDELPDPDPIAQSFLDA